MLQLQRSSVVFLVFAILVGCGPGAEEPSGNSTANSNTTGANNTVPNQTSMDANATTPRGEDYRGDGWLQRDELEQGLWIEEEQASLPGDCFGALGATTSTTSLAYTIWNGEDSETGGLDARGFTARPDLMTPPTPIYHASVSGLMLPTSEQAPYTRTLDLGDRGPDELIDIDVCETMRARGACHIPTDALGFAGCHGGGFMYGTETITLEEDGTLALGFNRGSECDLDNRRMGSHPRDLPLGTQTVRISPGTNLEDGQVLELTPDMIDWKSSIKASHDCSDLTGPAPLCSCHWDQVEVGADLERGWLLKQGDTLYLELKSGVRGEDNHIWGGFEIVE